MNPRPRKIITRVIVFLLLGAIVNVAVAWGCHSRLPRGEYVTSVNGPSWQIRWLANHGWVPTSGCVVTCESFLCVGASAHFYDELPRSYTGPRHTFAYYYNCGFPFRSFESHRFELEPPTEMRLLPWIGSPTVSQNLPQGNFAGILVTGGTRSISGGTLSLPLIAPPQNLIWFGLVANSLLYAMLAFFLYSATQYVLNHPEVYSRSQRRLKLGRCPGCGYDLRENGNTRVRYLLNRGCPECGWNRKDKIT